MDLNFQDSFTLVLDDFAPPTWGLCQAEYDSWRSILGLPKTDIKDMPRVELVAMYRQQYWVPECPILPIGLDYLLFDMKAKLGAHMATTVMQVALAFAIDGTAIVPDGHWGVITMAAALKANVAQINDKLVALKGKIQADVMPPNLKTQEVHDRCAQMLAIPRPSLVQTPGLH